MARDLCPKPMLTNTGAGMGTLPCNDQYMGSCHDPSKRLTVRCQLLNAICSTARCMIRIVQQERELRGKQERGLTLKVGDLRDGGALYPVVPAAGEEGVVEVGQVRNNALLLRDAQHAQVPLAQVVAARRLLLCGVAVQDVVITLSYTMLLNALTTTSLRTSEGIHRQQQLTGVRPQHARSRALPSQSLASPAILLACVCLHRQNALHCMQPGERCRQCQKQRTAMGGQAQMNMEVKPRALT